MGLIANISTLLKGNTNKDAFGTMNPYSWAFSGSLQGYKANDIMERRTDKDLFNYYRSFPKTAIDAIAMRVSQIEFQLKDGNGDLIEHHWILDLLNHPNDDMTGDELIRRISSYLDLVGRAPIFAPRMGKIVEGLIPLPPVNFKAQLDKQGSVVQYVLQNGGEPKAYEKETVVFFRTFNPVNVYDGFSTTRAAIYAIETLFELENWEYQNIKNGANPTYGISYDKDLNQQQLDQIRTRLAQIMGGSNNAGAQLLLANGGKYFPTGLSLADFSASDMKSALRDIILGYYGVPKAVLGISDDVNRANGESGISTFYSNVIDPRMRLICDGFQEFLVRPFFKDYTLTYKNPIPEDKLNNAKIFQLASAGKAWMTPNEIRKIDGLEEIDGGDDLTAPAPTTTPDNSSNNSKPNSNENNQSDQETGDGSGGKNPKGGKKGARLRVRKSVDNKAEDREQVLTADMDRGAVKKALDLNAKRIEAKCVTLIGEYSDEMEKRVSDKLKTTKSFNTKAMIETVFNKKDELGAMMDLLDIFYTFATKEFLNEVMDELGLDRVPEGSEDLKAHLAKVLADDAEYIITTLRDKIKESLAEGVKNGDGIEELKQRIMDVATQLKESQAYTIAQTESTGIANATHMDIYDQEDVAEKEWASIHDLRTRDSHVAADTQKVPLNDPFTIGEDGEKMMYPGDPSASAKERINCRCRILAA